MRRLRLRSRLVQRIYFVGILQFVVVAAATAVLMRAARPPLFINDAVRFLTHELEVHSDTPEALEATVQRIHADLHWSIALYDGDDRLVAAAGASVGHPSSSAGHQPSGDLPLAGTVPLFLHGRGIGRVEYIAPGPRGPPLSTAATTILVLVVVGISSWLTARSLAIPLARLAATANALGAGDFSARAALQRSDELGDVANAFDTMAERVASSIRAERELLANISHELRTPLHRIRIALDLAAEGDAETARESLKEITEDLSELERLVIDVLAATRLSLAEGGRTSAVPPLRSQLIGVRALLDKVATRFRGAHPRRQLELSIDTDGELRGDPVLVRRMIDNLLENAHKYSEDSDDTSDAPLENHHGCHRHRGGGQGHRHQPGRSAAGIRAVFPHGSQPHAHHGRLGARARALEAHRGGARRAPAARERAGARNNGENRAPAHELLTLLGVAAGRHLGF